MNTINLKKEIQLRNNLFKINENKFLTGERYLITGCKVFFIIDYKSKIRFYPYRFFNSRWATILKGHSISEVIGELPEEAQDFFIKHINLL